MVLDCPLRVFSIWDFFFLAPYFYSEYMVRIEIFINFFEIFILLCTPATSHSTTAALHSLLYHRKTQKLADWIFINIFFRFFNFGATIYFGNIVEDHTNIDVKKPVFGHIYFPPKLGKLYIHVLYGWKFDTFRNTPGTTDRRNRFSFFLFFDLGRRCVLYAILDIMHLNVFTRTREKSGTKVICNAATPLTSRIRVCDIDIKPADVIFIFPDLADRYPIAIRWLRCEDFLILYTSVHDW